MKSESTRWSIQNQVLKQQRNKKAYKLRTASFCSWLKINSTSYLLKTQKMTVKDRRHYVLCLAFTKTSTDMKKNTLQFSYISAKSLQT